MHTLSTRATSVQVPAPDDPSKTVPKKVYYLVCGFCRWTSRDVGIADQTAASGGWQAKENPHSQRINALMEHYRVLAQKEKLEKERKKLSQRCGYLHFSDKYGISSIVARKLAGISPVSLGSKDDDSKSSEELPLPVASAEAEPLPESIFTEPLNLATVCTLNQRLFQPQFQPVTTSELYPQQKYLHIKRSQRCKECEHNLSKPEYNPSSIKFKIQLAAFYHIPELRIKSVPPLEFQKETKVELTLCNPTPHPCHITFLHLDNAEELQNFSLVVLPPYELILAPRDDTAEFDDINDNQAYRDDPAIVTFRKSNKIGFLLTVTPQTKNDVMVSFRMKHDFINMVVQLQGEQREPQIVWLTHTLQLNLGPVTSSS